MDDRPFGAEMENTETDKSRIEGTQRPGNTSSKIVWREPGDRPAETPPDGEEKNRTRRKRKIAVLIIAAAVLAAGLGLYAWRADYYQTIFWRER